MASLGTESLSKLLLDNSTRQFYVQYNNFFFNHMSQGIIALHRLGASEERIHQFINWLGPQLQPANKNKEQDHWQEQNEEALRKGGTDTSNEDAAGPVIHSDLLGKRRLFYPLLATYHKLLTDKYQGSADRLIAESLPALSLGLLGGALHGIIQTGYGYAANESWLVCKGLAYMHFSNIPLDVCGDKLSTFQQIGSGNTNITDILDAISRDDHLQDFLQKERKTSEFLNNNSGRFTAETRALFNKKPEKIIEYARDVKFPDFFDIKSMDTAQLQRLLHWVLDCAITAYLLSERTNDFFLLHGVTSSWALSQLAPVFQLPSELNNALKCVRSYLCSIIAAYIVQGAPRLRPADAVRKEVEKAPRVSWEELIGEVLEGNREEHVFKLVQCCYEASKNSDDADKEWMYKCAAKLPLDHEFMFSPPGVED